MLWLMDKEAIRYGTSILYDVYLRTNIALKRNMFIWNIKKVASNS